MPLGISSNPEEAFARRGKIENEISDFQRKASEKFSGDDLKKINEALDFMLKIHLPQKDRADGRPFASHPLAVAEKVMEMSDDAELVVAALVHDGVEDQSDHIFVERVNRKYPDKQYLQFSIDAASKERYGDIFRDFSFKEIKERFGDQVKYYTENMTNHDFNSLAEDSGLTGEDKQDFINKRYAEHAEDIINDPKLFILKLADLSVNIDLHSLDPNSDKYKKLKRKYKSVIEAFLEKLKGLEAGHPLYNKKDEAIAELEKIYDEQYR